MARLELARVSDKPLIPDFEDVATGSSPCSLTLELEERHGLARHNSRHGHAQGQTTNGHSATRSESTMTWNNLAGASSGSVPVYAGGRTARP